MKLFSITNLFLITVLCFFFSCKEKGDATLKSLEDYQTALDGQINDFETEQKTIRQSITENAASNQDTFALAKALVPIKTTKFLLETQYDVLTSAIKDYQSKKMTNQEVTTLLKDQKEYVENLLDKNTLDK
ncbi:MAG: hypothetical protein ACPG19_07425 [Saprospiraceae bacterium]